MRKIFCVFSVLIFITGCASEYRKAPVEESKWYRHQKHAATYRVKQGDTLYAIAFRHDTDYRKLAVLNNLPPPYKVKTGQILLLKAVKKTPAQSGNRLGKRVFKSNGVWRWPARGKVVAGFVPGQGKKGIDIAGKKGDKVYASASGMVAYAGNGLNGYGNLIIIRHEGQFLTAYGNNQKNKVVEGQKVKAGQIIADMGIVDRKFWGVHFEIRKAGHPVNPVQYLP